MIVDPPEKLKSRFRVTACMLVDLLQRDAAINDPSIGNFASVRELIENCHDDDEGKRHVSWEKPKTKASPTPKSVLKVFSCKKNKDKDFDKDL